MEGTPLSNACEWLAENPSESASVASRIFRVPRSTIRSSISRLQKQSQKQKQKELRGGKNKVLSAAQTEALKQWILEQYYLGLGANRPMVYAAVCYLRSPLPLPSQSWLTKYIQKELLEFHFITTKPLAQ
jgi:transposase